MIRLKLMKIRGLTDIGNVRENNEDTFIIAPINDIEVFAVFDGMGGAQAGEVASKIAADTVMAELHRDLPTSASTPEVGCCLTRALQAAHRQIARTAREERLYGMGTTATVAVCASGYLHVAQVGDSRAYLLRGNDLRQITRDQTVVQTLVDLGSLSEEQARNHPRSSCILQALGLDKVTPVLTRHEVVHGDIVLLCSDGLSNMLSFETIRQTLLKAEDPLATLIDLAKSEGGYDNITVVLANNL